MANLEAAREKGVREALENWKYDCKLFEVRHPTMIPPSFLNYIPGIEIVEKSSDMVGKE